MHNPERSLNVNYAVIPAANESIIPLDSTRGTITNANATIGAANTTYLAPGRFRNRWAGAVVVYSVATTTQNVTATEQILTGQAGTSGDWETQATGSHTVTAGTTSVFTWTPAAGDFRLKIDAGGTGPATCVIHVEVLWGARAA